MMVWWWYGDGDGDGDGDGVKEEIEAAANEWMRRWLSFQAFPPQHKVIAHLNNAACGDEDNDWCDYDYFVENDNGCPILGVAPNSAIYQKVVVGRCI